MREEREQVSLGKVRKPDEKLLRGSRGKTLSTHPSNTKKGIDGLNTPGSPWKNQSHPFGKETCQKGKGRENLQKMICQGHYKDILRRKKYRKPLKKLGKVMGREVRGISRIPTAVTGGNV